MRPQPNASRPGNILGKALSLPWQPIALFSHFILNILITILMLFVIDGYQAHDPSSSFESSKLRASDIVTGISVGIRLIEWTASFWSAAILVKAGYVVWLNGRKQEDPVNLTNCIRRTMEYHLPFRLGSGAGSYLDYNLIRLSVLIATPALLASPLLQGSIEWIPSSEQTGFGTAVSRDPAATFFNWNYANEPGELWAKAWEAVGLAGVAFENGTLDAFTHDVMHQTCRHIMTHSQFPTGSVLRNATIPCIVIHDITWPAEKMPPFAKTVLNDSALVSPSGERLLDGSNDISGNSILFDPTNQTLPIPAVFPGLQPASASMALPSYPEPFKWSGIMLAIVSISRNLPYPPYHTDLFGYDSLPNSEQQSVSYTVGTGVVEPAQIYTYLRVNFTAGVVNPAKSLYTKPSVVEAIDNDPDGRDVMAGPWVREALYLTSEIMSNIAIANSTSIPTWHNLQNYTETLIRHAYLASWDSLHRHYEPNNTDLVVELQEPRIRAAVSHWRVFLWAALNVLFSASGVLMFLLHRRNEELQGVNGATDFILRVYEYLDTTPTMPRLVEDRTE